MMINYDNNINNNKINIKIKKTLIKKRINLKF